MAVDARLRDGAQGGIQQVVLGLAHGLSALDDGDEEYLFLTLDGEDQWLSGALRGRVSRLPIPPASLPRSGALWRAAARVGPVLDRLVPSVRSLLPLPRSDGTIERAGVEVMHFTAPSAFLTGVPSVYQPHDLQHLHLPQMFPRAERVSREKWYRAFCAQARTVSVGTTWTKADFVARYRIPADKVQVIPLAPVTPTYAALPAEAAARFRATLPPSFALYPAATFPHKNHAGLLRALAAVPEVQVVCTGMKTDHLREVEAEARRLGVSGRIHFLGFVSPPQLRALYGWCAFVCIPTLFESASFPVWEAFESGAAVAASNVTSLPAQVGDAGLLFDPRDPLAIAAALRRLWNEPEVRSHLAAKGRERVRAFSWQRTARMFRALYRRTAGRGLTGEDRALLEAPALL